MTVRTLGILAHVDAGKTTLCEQILCGCGAIRRAGRVDNGDSYLDTDPLEKARGITIYTGAARFRLADTPWVLLDTPGHVDFLSEMERVLPALDAAVLVISCVEGVQSHTETIFRCLREQKIPTFFFLNKTDRAGADIARVMAEIHSRLTPDAVFCEESWQEDALYQRAAEQDEGLLERYLEEDFAAEKWQAGVSALFAAGCLFPCFAGSALQNSGIFPLLQALQTLTPHLAPAREDKARVIRIRREKSGVRRTFLRVLGEELAPKQCLGGEKIADLMQPSGEKLVAFPRAECGDIVAVSGLLQTKPGQLLGEEAILSPGPAMTDPMMQVQLLYPPEIPYQTVWEDVSILTEEDPQLHASLQLEGQPPSIWLHTAGRIQREVLADVMQRRFSLPVSFGPCRVLYKETITAPFLGCGHYEPLRHYAEVHVRLSPAPRGSGVHFQSEVPEDVLARNWQRLIETHVFERSYPGALTGSPLTDVVVTLMAGRAHVKHTEGGDFRRATLRAIRQALFKAALEDACCLLEPWVHFSIALPPESVGRFLSDLTAMGGQMEESHQEGPAACLTGRAPFAGMSDYGEQLTHYTRGEGRLSFSPSGYFPCHNSQSVVEEIGYDRQADRENPADSVFCSHGAGLLIPWEEADRYMHIPL